MSMWNVRYQIVSNIVYRKSSVSKVFLVRTFNNLYFSR